MNDKLQETINALRAAGDEAGAKAVEELRATLNRTMEQYHAGQRAAYENGRRERDAYKWGYEYLQDRMESLGRHGWAHDCDGEIESRIAAATGTPT